MDNQPLFISIVTNAGGEGKTLLAMLFHTVFHLMHQPAVVLDSDVGNYSSALQLTAAGGDVRILGWSVGADKAGLIAADQTGRHVIFDTGANQSASHREVVDLLPELRTAFASVGHRPVMVLPVSTNKAGAAEAVVRLASKFADFECIFVRVNRDSSGHFLDDNLDPARTVSLGHLAPGYQAYARDVSGGLLRAVRMPLPGYELAAAHLAQWMRKFVEQPLIKTVLGSAALAAIDNLNLKTPVISRFHAKSAADVTDQALKAAASRTRQIDILAQHGWSAAAHRQIADMLDAGAL